MQFLDMIETVAEELERADIIVVAHSDHGLVRTHHSPALVQELEALQQEFQFRMGGAGRTRWIYPKETTGQQRIVRRLEQILPSTVAICTADDVFDEHSLARKRVGDIVLIATGEAFVSPADYCFDHGSFAERELDVPLAVWNG